MSFRSITIQIILLLILSAFNAGAQDTADLKFSKGSDYFSEGNYGKALEEWTSLYTAGYRSAILDYNIGNAYFKLGNIPASILFYERARLRKPADEDITYNLSIARAMTTDRLDEIPELFFVRWYDFFSLVLASDSWAVISLVSFILCLVFLSFYFYSSKYTIKVTGFWLALVALLLSLASFSFSLRNRKLIHESNKAIIFSPIVNGKSSPDDSGTDLFVIHEGLRVSVEDEVGDWKEIRLPDGNKGWVPANSLEII